MRNNYSSICYYEMFKIQFQFAAAIVFCLRCWLFEKSCQKDFDEVNIMALGNFEYRITLHISNYR